MSPNQAAVFWELIRTPFLHAEAVWGIVPLYFGWILNELTSAKSSYTTALQTGFSFLWAGAHWSWQHFSGPGSGQVALTWSSLATVSVGVTLLVLALGGLAFYTGLRKRYPRGFSFLGHTRFANYLMIAIFPIQSGYLDWSWERVGAIALFALPLWLVLHFGLMPLRK